MLPFGGAVSRPVGTSAEEPLDVFGGRHEAFAPSPFPAKEIP
jgi:hypothetical protein